MKEMKEVLPVFVLAGSLIVVGLALEPSGEFGLPWIFIAVGIIAFVIGAIKVVREI